MPGPMLLVVDDNKENRTHLARRLARDGYQVLTAESGALALETLELQPVALVLLDLQMPDMDGLEVLEHIRAEKDENELPVLMVSANTDTATKVAAMDRGANDYLHKPVEYDFLLAKVRQTLRARESGNHSANQAQTRPASKAAREYEIGDSLSHYRLDNLLGQGGMGKVFRAHDQTLLRDVALKVMTGELEKVARQRFLNEARAVARISHPNVITIYEIGESPVPFLAMELVLGKELDELTGGQPVEPARAVPWTLQIAEALEAVHQSGILHRDLKPSNVMVSESGRVKVMDFGLAKIAELDQKLTRTGDIWGTPQFMSPEHFDPNYGEVDAQSDLFALSGIFYQLLTGHPPFRSNNMAALIYEILSKDPAPVDQLRPGLDPRLASICQRGLSKQKSQRHPDATAFIQELQAVL